MRWVRLVVTVFFQLSTPNRYTNTGQNYIIPLNLIIPETIGYRGKQMKKKYWHLHSPPGTPMGRMTDRHN